MAIPEDWLADFSQENRFPSPVYSDEPILFTAAQMKNSLPPKYREMRRLEYQSGRRSTATTEIFYRQGKFMENYEDDCPFQGEFVRYFPTYESMSDRQLRGYFTWRTCVRRGDIKKTSLSYAYVYIYELLCGIGVSDAEDGFRKLRAFREAYRQLDSRIEHYLDVWMRDYVISNDLDPSYLAEVTDLQFDHALTVLRDCLTADDDALFDAICALSTYRITRSRYYRGNEKQTGDVLCETIRSLSDYFGKHRKNTLTESYFGRVFTTPYTMFYNAIVYQPKKQPDRTYTVSELCSYTCKDGKWSCTRVWGKRGKNAELGGVVRAVDALLRENASFPFTLKTDEIPKYLRRLILDAIVQVQDRERQRAAREVRIDLSKLQSIRDASEVTRERLIVEDEPESEPQAQSVPEQENGAEPERAENDPGLDAVETQVLRALLLRQDVGGVLRESGRMLSVVVDAINEKCFDRFGDTVLVFDGETPEILEDYEEELKEMLL